MWAEEEEEEEEEDKGDPTPGHPSPGGACHGWCDDPALGPAPPASVIRIHGRIDAGKRAGAFIILEEMYCY